MMLFCDGLGDNDRSACLSVSMYKTGRHGFCQQSRAMRVGASGKSVINMPPLLFKEILKIRFKSVTSILNFSMFTSSFIK